MYCLKNITHTKMPNDIVLNYCKLYQFVGRNQTMLKTVDKDLDVLIAQTVRLDTYFFAQFFDITVSENRFRQLLVKDVQAKSKDERFIKNIKHAFEKVHVQTETFSLLDRELHDLLLFIYKGIEKPTQLQFAKQEKPSKRTHNLFASSHATKRESLEELIHAYQDALKSNQFEVAYASINFYIDFINLKPFMMHNDVIGLMILYILLVSSEFKSLHLSSFFEMLYKLKPKFLKLSKDASHNWIEGLADTVPLHRFMVERLIESYQNLHELLRNYTYDKQTNKSDYIENTINKLPEVFTKEAIRTEHPTISISTIDRTLKRLRDEKKIRPLGKGRSAKWMKLYKTENKQSLYEQIKFKV